MRIVQFTRFTLLNTQEQSMLAARAASLESWRAAYPQLRDVLLVRLDGGEWLDVAVWEQDAIGDEVGSIEDCPPPEARDDFLAQIDDLLGEECGLLVAHSAEPGG